jgi:hypothetical protein
MRLSHLNIAETALRLVDYSHTGIPYVATTINGYSIARWPTLDGPS